MRHLAAVKASLGGLFVLAVWVIDELCWAEIGRRLDINPRTARIWAAASVSGLAGL